MQPEYTVHLYTVYDVSYNAGASPSMSSFGINAHYEYFHFQWTKPVISLTWCFDYFQTLYGKCVCTSVVLHHQHNMNEK